MKILFDQGTPIPLRNHLQHHAVETAYEKGWSDLKNGDLLARAEAEGFDALITTDQNLRHQQNLTGRRIRDHVAQVVQAVDTLRPGSYEEIAFP